MTVAALSGYAFSRLRWRGRNVVFLLFLATLIIPQDVLVIPMYVMMQNLGWVDTVQALIIPWAFTALGAFLCSCARTPDTRSGRAPAYLLRNRRTGADRTRVATTQ
ncbi:ABC transporter permease family protein [Streptomyces asiaticus]|uniref:hypothetical protein n=1 Tax=Streptomyces asiaticus TaxID=114695 RepID=UPI0038016849